MKNVSLKYMFLKYISILKISYYFRIRKSRLKYCKYFILYFVIYIYIYIWI